MPKPGPDGDLVEILRGVLGQIGTPPDSQPPTSAVVAAIADPAENPAYGRSPCAASPDRPAAAGSSAAA